MSDARDDRGSATEQFGPYLVYERLGQGGMATVHRAEKRGVGIRKPIALKRLLPHIAADPQLVTLFVDEARLASQLHHANIAQTYELGRVGETFFIAMEYASGPTLTQIVRQCQRTGSEIPIAITVNILSQICEALDYAHNLCDGSGRSLNIIHRDVSPANVIVANTGIVKLIDFGIAKATISSVKTQTGLIKGKFGYIAPEYITGKIDARVDLFAVGVIAHEMLAGRRLFEGKDDFETMANIRDMVLEPPSRWDPRIPADLDDIVMTALERDPAERWQSAGALQFALAQVARELGVVVGSQQLVEWVEWAFDQVAVDTGSVYGGDTAAGDTDSLAVPVWPGRRESSVSIELGLSQVEVIADLVPPAHRAASPSPSDSDETVPVERVAAALSDFETLTPPVIAPVRPTTAPAAGPSARAPRPALPFGAGRPSQALDAAAPSAPRSQSFDAAVPPALAVFESRDPATPQPRPPVLARPSRQLDAAVPRVPLSREIEVIVVPPGAMFEERRREPPAPAEPESTPPAVRAGDVDTEAAPRSSSNLWLILLMIALGIAAMAAAYFWPEIAQ